MINLAVEMTVRLIAATRQSLLSDIPDENARVWLWTATRLGKFIVPWLFRKSSALFMVIAHSSVATEVCFLPLRQDRCERLCLPASRRLRM